MKHLHCPRALALAALLTAGCQPLVPLPPAPQMLDEPPADAVESMLFLVGDAGEATTDGSPVMLHLRRQVERWSQMLARDSSVVVVFLGDNVYPRGMHPPDDPLYPQDSTRLQSQVDVVAGPASRQHGSYAVFLAGNHDWGHMPGERGLQRVRNSEDFLDRARARGPDVRMLPRAGTAGPHVIEIGSHIDLLLFDTSWWLLESSAQEKTRFFEKLDSVFVAHDHREMVIAAHHPYRSASTHAGLVPFWRTLGLHYVLARSGSLIQDLNSRPYRDLLSRIDGIFARRRPPLVFVGGHDHGLQVMEPLDPEEPRHILVSGAGSKTAPIGGMRGMQFRSALLGYMRLAVLRDGRILLFVDATPSPDCSLLPEADRSACLETGAAAFGTVYASRLK